MIEDKTIGMKFAENKEETFWLEAKDKCEKSIFNAKKEQEINEYILGLCELHLEEIKKNGS